MKELLAGLKDVGNEGRQMEALVELCEVNCSSVGCVIHIFGCN